MKKILKGFFISLAALAAPLALAGGDAAAGQSKAATCAACHGADGNSAVATFPKLAGLGEKYLVKQMQDIKEGDRKVAEMTGMLNNVSDQDMADIAAYYNSKERQLSGATESKLELGERVYRGGNIEYGIPACIGCHSPSGNGNAPAGYPALGGQHAGYIAKQLRAFRTAANDPEDPSGRDNDGETRPMRGVTARLTDQEIDAVANFIAGLH